MEDKLGGSRKLAIGLGALGVAALVRVMFLCSDRSPRRPSRPALSVAPGNYVGVASCAGSTCHGRSEARRHDRPPGRADAPGRIRPARPARTAAPRRCCREPRGQRDRRAARASARRPARRCASAATPTRAAPARRRASSSPTASAARACHGGCRRLAGEPLCGRRHPRRQRRATASPARQSAGARRASASTAISARPAPASSSPTGSWPPAIRASPSSSTCSRRCSSTRTSDADYRRSARAATNGVQIWAVGQAMALERVADACSPRPRGSEGIFPEFYFFDCHSCHRPISDDPRFRAGASANPGPADPVGHAAVQRREHDHALGGGAGRGARPGRPLRRATAAPSTPRWPGTGRRRSPRPAGCARHRASARRRLRRRRLRPRRRPSRSSTRSPASAIARALHRLCRRVQAVMAIDTLLNALVSGGQVAAAPPPCDPRRHQPRLSRGARSQRLSSARHSGRASAAPRRRSGRLR